MYSGYVQGFDSIPIPDHTFDHYVLTYLALILIKSHAIAALEDINSIVRNELDVVAIHIDYTGKALHLRMHMTRSRSGGWICRQFPRNRKWQRMYSGYVQEFDSIPIPDHTFDHYVLTCLALILIESRAIAALENISPIVRNKLDVVAIHINYASEVFHLKVRMTRSRRRGCIYSQFLRNRQWR